MSRDFVDYYAELGVDSSIAQGELKNIWRNLARKHHPDLGGDKISFQRIEAAHSVLSDPQKKLKFDADYKAYFFGKDYQETHRQERERTNAAWDPNTNTREDERKQKETREHQAREQRERGEQARSERARREREARESREREAQRRAEEILRERAKQEEERAARESAEKNQAGNFNETWARLRQTWANRKSKSEAHKQTKHEEKEYSKDWDEAHIENERVDIREGDADFETKLKHPVTTLKSRFKPKVVPESYWLKEKEKAADKRLQNLREAAQTTGNGENKG